MVPVGFTFDFFALCSFGFYLSSFRVSCGHLLLFFFWYPLASPFLFLDSSLLLPLACLLASLAGLCFLYACFPLGSFWVPSPLYLFLLVLLLSSPQLCSWNLELYFSCRFTCAHFLVGFYCMFFCGFLLSLVLVSSWFGFTFHVFLRSSRCLSELLLASCSSFGNLLVLPLASLCVLSVLFV